MDSFLSAASAFPTAIFSVLLGVVLVYWLLSILGVVDSEHHHGDGHGHFEGHGHGHGHLDAHHGHGHDAHDIHHGHDAHADSHDLGTVAGIAAMLGLTGVPLSVALTAVVLVAWVLSCTGGMLLLPMLPSGGTSIAAGSILGLGSLTIALPIAGQLVRPLKPLFVTHAAQNNASLVGQTCKILTQTVDEQLGRAEVAQRGANLNIRVWAPSPNRLTRGATARIVSYDDANARYRIDAES